MATIHIQFTSPRGFRSKSKRLGAMLTTHAKRTQDATIKEAIRQSEGPWRKHAGGRFAAWRALPSDWLPIGRKTGEFSRGWQSGGILHAGPHRRRMRIWNSDPKADWIMYGTPKMMARPIDVYLQDYMKKVWHENMPGTLSKVFGE